MMRHVVLLNFRHALSREDQDGIERSCAAIRQTLTGILSLEFVRNTSDRGRSYTHAFVADFVDRDAHDRYQQAPVHATLKSVIGALCDDLIVLDYQTLDLSQ